MTRWKSCAPSPSATMTTPAAGPTSCACSSALSPSRTTLDVQEALRGNFRFLIRFLTDAMEEGKRRGLVSQDVDSVTVAWQFLSLGLSLDVMYLLGFGRGRRPAASGALERLLRPLPSPGP